MVMMANPGTMTDIVSLLTQIKKQGYTRPELPTVLTLSDGNLRYPTRPFTTRINIQEGSVVRGDGTIQTNVLGQGIPKGFVARSVFYLSDEHFAVTFFAPNRIWGPFNVPHMTPILFYGLEAVQMNLDCNRCGDVVIAFSDDIVPPMQMLGFGCYPEIRYGTGSTGILWQDVLWGSGGGSVASVAPIASRADHLRVDCDRGKHFIVRNTGLVNSMLVRIVGNILNGEAFVADSLTTASGLPIGPNDFGLFPLAESSQYQTLKMQVSFPAGGASTTYTAQFIGVD